jgi:hypothetical protein
MKHRPTRKRLACSARTYKDLAASATTTALREQFLKRAADTYGEAYQATGGYWTGINAATMNLLIGEEACAREIASKVRDQCLKEAILEAKGCGHKARSVERVVQQLHVLPRPLLKS